jgi:hypothetical protein
MNSYITEQDVQNYGSELIDLTQRAAVQAVAPHLQNLQQQNAELQHRLAQEARHRLDQQVERAVPNYREIDRDPAWHSWLLSIDALSGQQRQVLLNDAIAQGNAARVIGFFRGWQQQAADTGQAASSQQPPSRRMPTWSSGQRTYSRPEIAKLYRQHAMGAYRDREAEWARLEHDIIRASAEGRIAGGEPIGVK